MLQQLTEWHLYLMPVREAVQHVLSSCYSMVPKLSGSPVCHHQHMKQPAEVRNYFLRKRGAVEQCLSNRVKKCVWFCPWDSVLKSRKLSCFVLTGHSECLEVLLSWGIDVDQDLPHLGTPLYVACVSQQIHCIRKLLYAGMSWFK